MSKHLITVLCALTMMALIVGLDIALIRNRFWERLMANIGIVLMLAAFYMRFVREP
jgi:hypothetical protein